MSMPTFPENGADITQEQAFNMLLASIAMEELALSHILNAEGEKLQYILGTLPSSCTSRATTKEVLEVNRSVSDLLEQVMHNQLLLKGKLARILRAKERWSPPPTPCVPCPPHHSDICVFAATPDTHWVSGCPLPWQQRYCHGEHTCQQGRSPASLYPTSSRASRISFFFQLRASSSGAVLIGVQQSQNGSVREILSASSYACNPQQPVSLTGSAIVLSESCCTPPAAITFVLRSPSAVLVEQAQCSISAL